MPVNLRSVDLNLLTVFDAIVSEGSQSRAAVKLGMSQPAMSNALARLRAALDDPLFVRNAQGMTPTARARALADPVRRALDLIQTGLTRSDAGDRFDHRSSTRSVVIVTEDYGETVIMPHFMNWLMQTAPGIRVRVRRDPLGPALSKKLTDGSIDMAVRYFGVRDSELRARHLLDEEFVSMVRQDHPAIGDALSLAQYLELPHVVFGRLGRRGIRNSIVDRALAKLGLSRHIALQVPGFQSMAVIVRNTDFVCTLPRRMAQVYAHHFRLRVLKTPLELPPLPIYLLWSKAMDRDPGHRWLRESFYELWQRA
ncbi:MAG TPA: LysR family transcriptional regulator [Burkholderiaceae bacterium]|jgi:DNA-binding transcriptional LysR family regulator|nr:LysR family transcriptional regulator [Burkholderiaceae bacterium]